MGPPRKQPPTAFAELVAGPADFGGVCHRVPQLRTAKIRIQWKSVARRIGWDFCGPAGKWKDARQQVFTADESGTKGPEKCEETAVAMIAMWKYGTRASSGGLGTNVLDTLFYSEMVTAFK